MTGEIPPFGELLRAARIKAGLSQGQLGAELGVTQTTVSTWERGSTWPADHVVVRAETALKVQLRPMSAVPEGLGHAAFGSWLRDTRIAAGLSQTAVASQAGTTQPTVSAWERGIGTPDAATIRRLETVLANEAGLKALNVLEAQPNFGQLLRDARAAANLSQFALGQAIGISQTMVSTWERSAGWPDDQWIQLLERALGTRLRTNQQPGDAAAPETQFGMWVRRTRESKEMSVAQLSERSGVSMPGIYNIETGKTPNPRAETRKRLEQALDEQIPETVAQVAEEESNIVGLGELSDFDPHSESDLPTDAGVYVFYDISQRPIYVGESDNIRRRVLNHNEKFWFKRPIVETASFIVIKDKDLRKKVEQILIKFLKSNAVINKQHVDR